MQVIEGREREHTLGDKKGEKGSSSSSSEENDKDKDKDHRKNETTITVGDKAVHRVKRTQTGDQVEVVLIPVHKNGLILRIFEKPGLLRVTKRFQTLRRQTLLPVLFVPAFTTPGTKKDEEVLGI